MDRFVYRITAVVFFWLALNGCAGKKTPQIVEGSAGEFITGYGFSIDARYDPRFDKLVPSYKLLHVAIRNTSLQVIQMDPRKDRWLLVDAAGKKHIGVNSLRVKDRKKWKMLPEKMKALVDYPNVVPISYTVTFNLFFPSRTSLEDFQEIRYKNDASGQEFRIRKED